MNIQSLRLSVTGILLILSSLAAFGQEETNTPTEPKNTLFLEAFGNGLFGSINYERQLVKDFKGLIYFFCDKCLDRINLHLM